MGIVYVGPCLTVTEPDTYSYPRYLKAKKTVDARALNRRVWGRFLDQLVTDSTAPLRILEVGGGIGATVERLVGALESRSVDRLHYTFLDVNGENIGTAREELRTWARGRGYDVTGENCQVWRGQAPEITIRYVTGDLFEYASSYKGSVFNAVIAQAVFDLLNIEATQASLRPLLGNKGLWYLPIHFDGVTAFEPRRGLDSQIERLYHASMMEDSEGGRRDSSHCGRRLLRAFQQSDADLLEAGASDWVVHPRGEGYPAEEAYFLHHILHFIETELLGHPELDNTAFSQWIEERRRQVDSGALIYIAHQLDVLARAP